MFRKTLLQDGIKSIRETIVLIFILLNTVLLISLHSSINKEVRRSRLSKLSGDLSNVSTIPLEGSNSLSTTNQSSVTQQIISPRKKRLPNAIIIGSRKSGTRALLKFLEVNPSIRAAHNEVHFFDKPQNYKLGIDWYRKQMPESSENEITIEKSPAYFVTRGVAEKVKSMDPNIKLVLIFRNPVIRLVSDFSQLIANKIAATEFQSGPSGMNEGELASGDYGDEHYSSEYMGHLGEGAMPPVSLNQSDSSSTIKLVWIKAEKDFEKYVLRPDGGIDDQRRAVKIGMYSNYLEHWRALFPSDQFHFVDGERLITNPYEELHELEQFLGLKPVIKPEDFVFNPRKGFYCLSQFKNSTTRDNGTSLETNDNQIISQNTIAVNCLSKSKGRKHIKVRKDLLEKLENFYEPYNEYLYSLTEKNFNWPKKITI